MSPFENGFLCSDAVAVTFGNRILGPLAWLMPLSVAFSTFGAANGTIFAAGRLCYVASRCNFFLYCVMYSVIYTVFYILFSREGHLVDVLSFVHVKKLTPAPAVLFHALVAFGMVVSGSIEGLIDFFSFTVWIFYGMSMAALLVIYWPEVFSLKGSKAEHLLITTLGAAIQGAKAGPAVQVSDTDPHRDADNQLLPGHRPHSGQSPDRVSLLHPLHGTRCSPLHPICVHGIRLQVHGQSDHIPSGKSENVSAVR